MDTTVTDQTQAANELMSAIYGSAPTPAGDIDIFQYVRSLDHDGLLIFLKEANAARETSQWLASLWWTSQIDEASRLYVKMASAHYTLTTSVAQDCLKGINAVALVDGYDDPLGWIVAAWLKFLSPDNTAGLDSMRLTVHPDHLARIHKLATLGNMLTHLNM